MKRSLAALVVACLSLLGGASRAQNEAPLSTGQTLYLPIYSHIYHGDLEKSGKPRETLVSTHISLRNTDPRQPVKVLSARYFDTQGKPVREFLAAPEIIPAMGSHELYVPRTDVSGGSGASLLIVWTADVPVNPLLVEALHADIREARTLVFVTTALPIRAR
jgi:hypothetical protein